jgi:hypothetical protein
MARRRSWGMPLPMIVLASISFGLPLRLALAAVIAAWSASRS